MPAAYPLPNWIQPADEAGNLARGIQLGESQARQRLLEKQQQFQEQQAAVDQARADMEFKMRSEAQARKFAGQQQFQKLIAGGMDPASALLQVAPLVNESLTGAAQLYKATQPPPPRVFDVSGGLYRVGQTGPSETLVSPPKPQPKVHIGAKGEIIETSPDGTFKVLRPPTESGVKMTVHTDEGDTITGTPEQIAAARKKESKGGRVNVKSPEGKTGTIPEEQLADALKAGYTEVK